MIGTLKIGNYYISTAHVYQKKGSLLFLLVMSGKAMRSEMKSHISILMTHYYRKQPPWKPKNVRVGKFLILIT